MGGGGGSHHRLMSIVGLKYANVAYHYVEGICRPVEFKEGCVSLPILISNILRNRHVT